MKAQKWIDREKKKELRDKIMNIKKEKHEASTQVIRKRGRPKKAIKWR